MNKIVKFIECLIPVTVCNLECEYCYIIQESRRKNQMPELKYTPKQIRYALRKERLGGVAYISICGAGETLVVKEIIDIVKELLEEGHYVNITTNGTLNNRFDEIIAQISKEDLKKLHFAFSLHYLELKKKNLLSNFCRNIRKVKENGCSYTLQMNLYDGYIDSYDEIKEFCDKNFGFLPQIAATRDELKKIGTIELYTTRSIEDYYDCGKIYNSDLFEFTMKNFMKKRKEFCYAGDWTFLLDLSTGEMRKCYCSRRSVNIMENPDKKIKFKAIGSNCTSQYCINSSHFISLGVIPELNKEPSYAKLRMRGNSYTKTMEEILNQKLYENNKQYSNIKKTSINIKGKMYEGVRKCGKRLKQSLTKVEH